MLFKKKKELGQFLVGGITYVYIYIYIYTHTYLYLCLYVMRKCMAESECGLLKKPEGC